MVTKEQKEALTNSMYLKNKGWLFTLVDEVGWGWIDPKTKEHYFEKEALQIQLIRDNSSNPRFGKEPSYHD